MTGYVLAGDNISQVSALFTSHLKTKVYRQIILIHLQSFLERLSEEVPATIPKGIVGGFEFTVLQRNLKDHSMRDHGHMFANAKGKQQK